MSLDDLGLRPAVARKLEAAGYRDVADLEAAIPRGLLAVEGIGPSALESVVSALATLGKRLADDAYAPYECARDGNRGYDVKLADLWLCDECAGDFVARPFGGTPPAYSSGAVDGYCVNCVRRRSDVALHQWFLCEVCARVAESFGRSVVASRALLEQWEARFRPITGIRLVEIDPPRLNRRIAGLSVAGKASAIDFEGQDDATGEPVFGIEQKTGQKGLGRGSVNPMSEFQLDCSDCDDIAAVAERRHLPVYLVHAQVVERASPPTRLFVPVGYWWTDAYAMGANCKDVRNRSREVRPAAYYPVSIFRSLEAFADHVRSGGPQAMQARIRSDGRFPAMYPGQPSRA